MLQIDLSCFNEYGESPIPKAPTVSFSNGYTAVPSQYLYFYRDQKNVERIISEIEFEPNFPIFVGNDDGRVYLRVGIIGFENYPRGKLNSQNQKIVYGRAWYIEPNAPTSEVLQTACLALKKAREHELREKLSLQLNNGENKATPFNSHIDAALMVKVAEVFQAKNAVDFPSYIANVLTKLSLNKLTFKLLGVKRHSFDQYLVDIELSKLEKETLFSDFTGLRFSVLCSHSHAGFLHELIARLIHLSDRYVEEKLSFRGFKRFSYRNCPLAIAQFSLDTRLFNYSCQDFQSDFDNMTYAVDAARIPSISNNEFGEKLKAKLASFGPLDGYLPSVS